MNNKRHTPTKSATLPAIAGMLDLDGAPPISELRKELLRRKRKPKTSQSETEHEPNDWSAVTELATTIRDLLSANSFILQSAGQILLQTKNDSRIEESDQRELGRLIILVKNDIADYAKTVKRLEKRFDYRSGPVLEDELMDFFDVCMELDNLMKDIMTVLNEPAIEISLLATKLETKVNTHD